MKEVEDILEALLSDSWDKLDELQLPADKEAITHLAQAVRGISHRIVDVGVIADKEIAEPTSSEKEIDALVIMYRWMHHAKQYIILWRDVLFEYQKSTLLKDFRAVSSEELSSWYDITIHHLKNATKEFEEVTRAGRHIDTSSRSGRNVIENWQLLNSPWSVYQSQFQQIITQTKTLIEDYDNVALLLDKGLKIKEITNHRREAMMKELGATLEMIDRTKKSISENKDEPGRLILQLETLEQQIQVTHSLSDYSEEVDRLLGELKGSTRFPIAAEDGVIQYRDVNFGKQIRQWLDTEVYPGLHDMTDIVDQVANSLKMALINIRNRAIITKDQKAGEEVKKVSLDQALGQIDEKMSMWDIDIKNINQELSARINNSLKIERLYDKKEEFLPVPLQTTLTQMRLEQNEFYGRIKGWVERQSKTLRKVKDLVIKEESLSQADKVVRYVRTRIPLDDRHQYDSIFKAEGYIGESFCVGRKYEFEEIEASINAWREGYRGSAIITGARHSGKTLFGEWLSHKYFPRETIVVRPDNVLNVEGRRLVLKQDLSEALAFIKKHTLNKKYLIWIDDVEDWNSPEIPLGTNIRSLIRAVDDLANRLYFVVTMNRWAKEHWINNYGLDRAFQTAIDLRPMSISELREAILIRHGATHKRLVDDEGKDILPSQFNKMVQKVERMSEGIIGDAFLLWANATLLQEDDHVLWQELPSYALPDFITSENGVLLKSILMRRSTTEYELRKLFGSCFPTTYKPLIQRLIAMGVVTRRLDDHIEINKVVANDVARLLTQHNYITVKREEL